MDKEKPFDFLGKNLVADFLKVEAFDEVLEFDVFKLLKALDDTCTEMGLLLDTIRLHTDRLKLLFFHGIFLHQGLSLSVRLLEDLEKLLNLIFIVTLL